MNTFRKIMVFTIIGLFLGAGVLPGISGKEYKINNIWNMELLPENCVQEGLSNEDNTIGYNLPDLQVPVIYLSGIIVPRAAVKVNAWIVNYGSVAVTDDFKVGTYLDGSYIGGQTWSEGLEIGQILVFSGTFQWPNDESSHTVTVKADVNGWIEESNENNNENSVTASGGDIVADFIWSVDGLTVTFTDTSTGGSGLNHCAWDFTDDGNDDKWGTPVTYTYPDSGTYTIKHWARGNDGSTDVCRKDITVDYKDPIESNFSYVRNGLTVTFTDTSTGGNGVYNSAWDFTDDGADDKWSTEVTHTYPSPGTYTVKHWVQGNDGSTDICRITITCKRSKAINTPFLRFLENHPHIFPLLRNILNV